MKVDEIEMAIKRVVRRFSGTLKAISNSQTQLLELASITGVAEHYKSLGYAIQAVNPPKKKGFVVKTTTRGYPWNFSYFVCRRDGVELEVHMNVRVRSAHDLGIYCVDVGVVAVDAIPKAKSTPPWECVANVDLLTFAETKKLVVYPMLLAQFIGIVHEICPGNLSGSVRHIELFPALITLGHFSGNSTSIVGAYPGRGINVKVVENYDMRLSRVRLGLVASPFS